LKEGFEKKIQTESEIFEGPTLSLLGELPSQKWDVSHTIQDGGSTLVIREDAILATNLKDQFRYQTRSKKVTAGGMAGYLKAVNFSMILKNADGSPRTFRIEFRNEVMVQRPWYALDLIFTPIARGVCFDKMEQVRDKMLPWVTQLLWNELDSKLSSQLAAKPSSQSAAKPQ
jgi:hypothetical protein